MLNEVIASLLGSSGCFFKPSGVDSCIQMESDLNFLHPAEETLIKRLSVLGSHYEKIENFAKKHMSSILEGSGSVHGLYASCFAHALNEVLDTYRTDVWEMELVVTKDPYISLSHILQMERYLPLFQHLIHVIGTMEKDEMHGCRILELVYSTANSGLPMIHTCFEKILKRLHVVLIKQIHQWMICGELQDPYNEFFISLDEVSESKSTCHSGDKSAVIQRARPYLKLEFIPSYILVQVAEKILFVGESVRILEPEHKYLAPSELRLGLQQFSDRLLGLSQLNNFSILKFTSLIAEIRACAAEKMWKVVVEDSDLPSFLRTIKDFYLIGRGEFYLIFIEIANKWLKMPLSPRTVIEVRQAFSMALFRVLQDGDSVSEKFQVVLKENKENENNADKQSSLSKTIPETGFTTFGLTCDVPHPLDIIFTPATIDKYNLVLRFLLNVRHVQIELNQCFILQMCNKGMERNSFLSLKWQLRAHMSFLIDNFMYYLQVDVIDSHFSDLMRKIETDKDFEAIQCSHITFLTSITSQSFLLLKPVYCCLLDILDLCSSFCSFIKKSQDILISNEMANFENIRLNFQRQTSLLYRVLCGIRSHQVSPHLAQFLLRLDYNKYLSTSGGHLGGPQARQI